MKTVIGLTMCWMLILCSTVAGKYGGGAAEERGSGDTLLILTSFDAMTIKARDNKKDLFRELTQNLSGYLSEAIKTQTAYAPVVIPGILNKSFNADSLVYSIINQHHVMKAVLIRSLDAFFEETGSHEETDDDGKPKTITSYDICARIEYSLYSTKEILKQSRIENCEFFTSRSVKGRFAIRFGPDIVGKRKHTYKVVAENAGKYIGEIIPLIQ